MVEPEITVDDIELVGMMPDVIKAIIYDLVVIFSSLGGRLKL